MAIIGEKIEDFVQEQIEIRQKTHGSGVLSQRTDDQLLTLNSKTAFIRLASGAWIEYDKLRELGDDSFADQNKGMGLAKTHILYGGYATLTPD